MAEAWLTGYDSVFAIGTLSGDKVCKSFHKVLLFCARHNPCNSACALVQFVSQLSVSP